VIVYSPGLSKCLVPGFHRRVGGSTVYSAVLTSVYRGTDRHRVADAVAPDMDDSDSLDVGSGGCRSWASADYNHINDQGSRAHMLVSGVLFVCRCATAFSPEHCLSLS
jgi:hypothetical protein